MVKLIVGPVNTQIQDLDDLSVIDAISQDLSYLLPGHQYNINFKLGRWDGREKLLTKRLKFPSGLVPRVCRLLDVRLVPYEVIEHIDYPEYQETVSWQGPSLYPYQEEVVTRALSCKRGMIKAATGSGKTIMISKIVAEYNVPTMIYVVSLDLLSQMRETLEEALGVEVGVIGGGECVIRKINVCSVWTAGLACGEKMKKTALEEDITPDKWKPSDIQREQIVQAVHDARLVVLDEAQFAAANSIRMILRNSTSASYKFGCTATPWRTSGDDILLEAAFGDQICNISATQLIEAGYLVTPKIAFRDIPPYHTKIPKEWAAVKSRYIVSNDERSNILIQNTLALLEMGRRPLMLFREIKHGKSLLSRIPDGIRTRMVTGSVSAIERDAIRQDFKDGQIDLLLASTVYDQGIDIKELDALILCGGGKSTAKALQRIGRVIRGNREGNKVDALVVETFDQEKYVQRHSFARYSIYKSESAFLLQAGPAMSQYLS